MSRVLVEALERIAAMAGPVAFYGRAPIVKIAREALAAHRASPLAGDEALRNKVATFLIRESDAYADDIGPGERAAYAEQADAVLRIVDEHLGRGGR